MAKNKMIKQKIEEINEWLINVRRDIHSTPEPGLEEFITKSKIENYLKEMNVNYKTFKNHTGIVAFIDNNKDKTIAIRSDIDALPILEKNDTPYKSKHEGFMHACGHDAHTAILLGTINILKNLELDCNLKFFFQPAEETTGGATLLIKDNCMENVDYIIGLHVDPNLEVGTVELKYDTLNASTDDVEIKIKGQKCHGAYPHQGNDAILSSAHVITSLQSIISRNINPTNSAVLSLCMINGGLQENIICDDVLISGTLRTLDEETRNLTKEKIVQISKNVCNAFSCDAEVVFHKGYDALINNNEIIDILKENFIQTFGDENVLIRKHPTLGAEDFSFFLNECMGAFYHIGCKNEEKNITSPLHTDTFDIDEDCLKVGVLSQVSSVLRLMKG
ncbi:MAG: M20 family metallopeptidase [Peptostreptococcaceae bacterium]